MTGASDQEAREFAKAFRTFLIWLHAAQSSVRNVVAALVGEFTGDGVSDRSVVSRSLRPFEHVNLQTALNAWSREPGRAQRWPHAPVESTSRSKREAGRPRPGHVAGGDHGIRIADLECCEHRP